MNLGKLSSVRSLRPGDPVLSDWEPATGKVIQFPTRTRMSKIQLDCDGSIVERDQRCLLRREQIGCKVTEFLGGYLLCKVHRFGLQGTKENPRSGTLYVATWYRTYVVGYDGRHTSPRCDTNIYCIVLDGVIVHRPRVYAEVASAAPETVGAVVPQMLCTV
jgi:hypothetical protein